jgi:RNA-directed DNA polymerase
MAQELTQTSDAGFSESSYGFRPKRSAHQAIIAARRYIEEGYRWTVDRPNRRKFLGFSFYVMKGKAHNFIHKKPIARFKAKVKEITSRSNGKSMEIRKERLNWLINGWVNYFHIADMEKVAKELDQWIGRRIRMCYWKQWKKISTRHKNLIKLGVNNHQALEYANTRFSYWCTAHSYTLATTLTNEYFEKQGFLSLTKRLTVY